VTIITRVSMASDIWLNCPANTGAMLVAQL
jgi:hypothetical protein